MGATAFGDAFWAGGRSRKIKARIVVEGDLILLTPAHFGNGDGSDETDLPLLADEVDPTRPLLTGASLAGALRAYLRRVSNNEASLDTALFGGAHGDDEGEQSPLIVDDALGQAAGVELRDGVKLDPTTRTAAEGALFNVETWAAGTTFPLRLELVVLDRQGQPEAAMQALAAALTGLSNGSITLGARKRRGYGQARVARWLVRRFNLAENVDDLLDWLRNGNDRLAANNKTQSVDAVDGNGRPLPDDALVHALLKAFGSAAQPIANQEHVFLLTAEFGLESSLLIRGSTGRDDLGPDMVHLHSKRNGKRAPVPILSGTSLAGALRARATRILNTLNPDKTQPIIAEMFGPEMKGKVTPKASRVIVEECEVVNAVTELVQNRIRIDRFTGGVVEGGLFSEQPAFGKPDTRLTIRLRLLDPKDHEIGLLLLLLKDLWTGDLPLGGEISVGRGRLRGRSATLIWKHNGQTEEWRIERAGDDPNDSHLKISGDQARLEAFVSEHLRRELFGAEVPSDA
jgi:CRISPR/Cas system CMR subunit Cmr4 (Cas7 group RAMP superfamily)